MTPQPHVVPGDDAVPGNEIVIGVDYSRSSESAVRWAARTASGRGLTLRIVHGLELGLVNAIIPAHYLQFAGTVDRLKHRAQESVALAFRTAHSVDPNLTVITEISPESAGTPAGASLGVRL